MRRLLLLSCLMLAACDGGSAPATVNKDFSMNPLSDINARLAFTCKHETIPAPSADTDMLFKYARWLQVNNRLKEDKTVDGQIERLYRIAAANGHYKANINLQNGAMRGQTRTLLVRQMGVRNSESTLYQKMLAQVANQYADMRLTDMTGDTDAASLFRTDEVVPGMFTRQAWEEAVQPAIDKVVNERREEMDWVLSDSRQPATQQTSPEALKQRLTARYFADFSTAWLDFLNSLRWQRAVTLSDAIDQLTLMADVRQSPLTGLETLAFNDGTPFADEVTLNWIQQQVMDSGGGWQEDSAVTAATASGDNDILQLESEALTLADSDGPDVALSWLQNRPGITTARSRWLLRLLMARVAEQTGKNELALHLLGELDGCAAAITLTQWEPDLLFEVKARRLKLLRMKAGRNDTDKTRLNPEMEHLLAGLIAIDPARAAVLCA